MALAARDPVIVDLSLVTGVVALILTAAFILLAVGVRLRVAGRAKAVARIEALWTPVLVAAVRGVPDALPSLRRSHEVAIVTLWNRFTDTLTGAAREHLVELARRCGIGDAALRRVRRGSGQSRLLAATTLGRLGDERAAPALHDLMRSRALVVRAEAARALVRISPLEGTDTVAALVAGWDDCHAATAVAILEDAPPLRAAEALGRELQATDDIECQLRLVDILGSVKGWIGLGPVRDLLGSTAEPELIARCLQVLRQHRQPDDAPLVRRFLHHDAPFVRVQAVAALGRIRAPGDEWRVLAALDDREWWVRYRAAHALADFPRISRRYLELVSHVHPDRYARGALQQVLSEAAALG